jgi:hypothetical protein
MPVKVQQRGNQYCVVEPGGSVVKCHSTKEKAMKHMAAMNINTKGDSHYGVTESPKPKKKKKDKTEGQDGVMDAAIPKVVIVSDGAPGSTRIFIKGAEVHPDRVDFCFQKADPNSEIEDYREGYMNLSMSVDMEDGDGLMRSMTIRLKADKGELEKFFSSHLDDDAQRIVSNTLRREGYVGHVKK